MVARRKGAAVAVTKCSAKSKADVTGIKALTAAAITLPGLLHNPALAYEEEASFSYGHYQEGKRELYGAQSAFSPIEVESVQGSGKWKLTDRIKFAFNYSQDTWGGATPISTAPLSAGGNGTFRGGSKLTSGATPYLNPSDQILLDKNLNVLKPVFDSNGVQLTDVNGLRLTQGKDQYVHTLSQASPEVRKQGDFKLSYEWDEAALDIGGGISIEDDYESRFGNINTRWDFNQKQTTLNVGLSYTNSDTHAVLDHDAASYFSDKRGLPQYRILGDAKVGTLGQFTGGTRQDWSTNIGLTQILNKNALIEANLAYTRSTGYMANPYKAVSVVFIDPELQETSCPEAIKGLQCAELRSLFEQRPEVRNQWNGSLRYVQHIESLDAAIHAGYRIYSDDWGITSHTFDADWVQPVGMGWSITPRVRYYSQDQADFYTPMLFTNQKFEKQDPIFDDSGRLVQVDLYSGNEYSYDENTDQLYDTQGNLVAGDKREKLALNPKTQLFNRNKLPQNFSSDHRLSGYGALSGGVTVTKQFTKGVALDLGFEYYTHQGSFKLGGGGENSFADFNYWTANAALSVNLEAMSMAMAGSHQNDHAHNHNHHHSVHAPAGVMFDHMLPAGGMMAGYRYMYGSQGGTMLNGDLAVSNAAIVTGGCGPNPCFLTPTAMSMHMHMLDLMYAPTDWLTLMLMPQFMDMGMNMSRLRDQTFNSQANNNVGNPIDPSSGAPFEIGQHIPHHEQNGHETGGLGDLGMYALVKLFDNQTHHLHFTAGFSAPIADTNIELRRNHKTPGGYIHYGMQLGSGTWDFKPSVTYTGHVDNFSWGAQANGTIRMEDNNKSGFAFGDIFQATAWGNYDLTTWLNASVRGVYTTQGAIKGGFKAGSINQFGPMDYPQSYGGKFWDVGFGLSAMVPSGPLAGNRISVEYLHPVEDDVNGYQLERDGSVSATWSLMF